MGSSMQNLKDVYIGTNVKPKWFKEIEERKILKSDEKMKGIIYGGIESSWGWGDVETDKTRHSRSAIARTGALICTDQRLVFYMPKILGRWEIETASLDQISSVNYTKGLIQGRLHITVFNDEKVIKWVNNKDGKAMADIIDKLVDLVKEKEKFIYTQTSSSADPLKVLKLRFVQGEISEEEYLNKKKLIES